MILFIDRDNSNSCKTLLNLITYTNNDIIVEVNEHADLVICSEVLEHVKSDLVLIKNIYDVLRQDGRVFLSTLNKNVPENKSKLDLERGHHRRYGCELEGMMESVGFETISFYPFRSSHYYENKGIFSNYNLKLDVEEGRNWASGWIYFGKKGNKK